MNTYITELSIGGTMRVKVEAKDEDAAQLVAALYFIDDWEGAGPLKIDDISIDRIDLEAEAPRGPLSHLDASIIAKPHGHWEFAEDDPYGRGE